MKKATQVEHIRKPNIKKLKIQDEELLDTKEIKEVDKHLSQEERFLKRILKRFKRL